MHEPDLKQQREKITAARISLTANVILTIIKVGVGIFSGSVSVIAEGAHSLTDVCASSLSLYSVTHADKPPDEEHPFGHGKIENLSALFQGLFLIGVAAFILREAIFKFMKGDKPESVGIGIVVMALSAVVNLFVIRYMNRVAKATDSEALRADALDHRADVYAAIGVFIGLLLVKITGKGFFDPLLAALVGCLIAWGAVGLVREGIAHLMDTALPKEEVELVQRTLQADPNVKGYHKLRTRKAGAFRQIDAHILMEDSLSLVESHALTEQLEDRLRDLFPNAAIHLHTEPYIEELRHQQEVHGETSLEYVRPSG